MKTLVVGSVEWVVAAIFSPLTGKDGSIGGTSNLYISSNLSSNPGEGDLFFLFTFSGAKQ